MITLTREANGNTLHFNKYEKWLTICLVYWPSGFRGQEKDSGLKNLSLNTYVSFALKLNFDLKEHNKNKSTQYNIETENWISFCKAVRYSSLIKYNFKIIKSPQTSWKPSLLCWVVPVYTNSHYLLLIQDEKNMVSTKNSLFKNKTHYIYTIYSVSVSTIETSQYTNCI